MFAETFSVYSLDLRNHGDSFHSSEMNYPVMADDVKNFLHAQNIKNCHIIGHSMGGKTAIQLARTSPEIIEQLIVADIAPVTYQHDYEHLLQPLLALELTSLESRKDVDKALQAQIPENNLRAFLLQNLAKNDNDLNPGWRWKVNWKAIQQEMPSLLGYEEWLPKERVATDTLFIRGEQSSFIAQAEREMINHVFQNVQIKTLNNAGHWLQAEQPQAFHHLVMEFLKTK